MIRPKFIRQQFFPHLRQKQNLKLKFNKIYLRLFNMESGYKSLNTKKKTLSSVGIN